MKLQARNFVVRKPETIDITMFFKKFCIATRTTFFRKPPFRRFFCVKSSIFEVRLTTFQLWSER